MQYVKQGTNPKISDFHYKATERVFHCQYFNKRHPLSISPARFARNHPPRTSSVQPSSQTGRSRRFVLLKTQTVSHARIAFEVTHLTSKHQRGSLFWKCLCSLLLKNIQIPVLIHQPPSSSVSNWTQSKLQLNCVNRPQRANCHERKSRRKCCSHVGKGDLSQSRQVCQNASFPVRTHCP